MYRIANSTNCLVIYVEYRLIPEFKYPVNFHFLLIEEFIRKKLNNNTLYLTKAPLDDCLDATKHLIKHNEKYKIDLDNLVLMGDSAGKKK